MTSDIPKANRSLSISNSDRRFLSILALTYFVFWSLLAFSPYNRFDWFLENLLVFLAVGLFALFYRRYPLSKVSYFLIFLFFCLHSVGSHYTYALTPIGDMASDFLGLERNHFDRFVHFCFGLLFFGPIVDFLERYLIPGRKAWQAFLSIILVSALSGFYELIEWLAAVVLEPEDALAFLGTQGDVFDGQKDSGLAFLGSVVAFGFWCLTQARPLRPRPR